LGWITKAKTKDFVGKEVIVRQKEAGLQRRLVGFEMLERGIPRQGYPVHNGEGAKIGEVTSGTQSPSLNKAIGMGYVATDFKEPGTEVFIGIRNKQVKARIVKPPFLKK